MNYNLPSLFSLLSRQSLLRRCSACYSTTTQATRINTTHNARDRPALAQPTLVDHAHNAHSELRDSTSAQPTRIDPAHNTRSERSEAYKPASLSEPSRYTEKPLEKRLTYEQVETYINRLKSGEVFDGLVWEQFFGKGSQITPRHGANLLRYAREAKIMTSQRYYAFLMHLSTTHEFVASQLALNTMVEDGIRLSNWQLLTISSVSTANYSLYFRLLSLMDLNAWDYASSLPRIAQHLRLVVQHFVQSETDMSRGMHLGHLMNMAPHMNSYILEAMATATTNPLHLAHAFEYISSTGRLAPFKVFEHFAEHLPTSILPTMFQHMRSRGLVPTAKMYTDSFSRLSSDTPPDFALQLTVDMLQNNKQTIRSGLSALGVCLAEKQIDLAFQVCEKLLQGPFTQDEHLYVSQTIRPYIDQFEGSSHSDAISSLFASFLQTPPSSPVSPHSLPVMDDEW